MPFYSIFRKLRDTYHSSNNISTSNLYAVATGLIFTSEGQVKFAVARINVATNRSHLGCQLMATNQQSDPQLSFNINNWNNERCLCVPYTGELNYGFHNLVKLCTCNALLPLYTRYQFDNCVCVWCAYYECRCLIAYCRLYTQPFIIFLYLESP